jgi:hypothetical protein
MSHAPKGGAYFIPTGDWYEGGQFMPTSEEPLPRGFRTKVRQLAAISEEISEIAAITGKNDRCIIRYRVAQTGEVKVAKFTGTLDHCLKFIKAVVAEKAAAAEANGVCPRDTAMFIY